MQQTQGRAQGNGEEDRSATTPRDNTRPSAGHRHHHHERLRRRAAGFVVSDDSSPWPRPTTPASPVASQATTPSPSFCGGLFGGGVDGGGLAHGGGLVAALLGFERD
mmetsp:Transcript_12017/g.48377  ORF Transcript_12017/g.48377 Transcript_12017/m.48377 type:complete len:107 (-) Transcript_12017:860-1180(-)